MYLAHRHAPNGAQRRAQDELWEGMAAEKDEEGNLDGLHRNASIRTHFAHPKATKHIMEFLRRTEVGRRVDEKQREDTRETRGEEWGWGNRAESEGEGEGEGGGGARERDMEGGEGGEMERGGEG